MNGIKIKRHHNNQQLFRQKKWPAFRCLSRKCPRQAQRCICMRWGWWTDVCNIYSISAILAGSSTGIYRDNHTALELERQRRGTVSEPDLHVLVCVVAFLCVHLHELDWLFVCLEKRGGGTVRRRQVNCKVNSSCNSPDEHTPTEQESGITAGNGRGGEEANVRGRQR